MIEIDVLELLSHPVVALAGPVLFSRAVVPASSQESRPYRAAFAVTVALVATWVALQPEQSQSHFVGLYAARK